MDTHAVKTLFSRLTGVGSNALAAVRSVAAYLFISLYVLLVGPLAMLVAWLMRSPRILYALGITAARFGLFIAGIRYRVDGSRHIRRDGPALYCVNHTSNVEPPVVFAVLRRVAPRLRILYKRELQSLPILGWCFNMASFVPVDRGNREQTRQAVEQGAQALREGNSFVIFPEGTRSRTGELLPFKKGGFVMAIEAEAPVVPMAIQGARSAMRKGSFLINPVMVSVRLGEPIETRGLTIADRDELAGQVRARIEELLAHGRSSQPDER